MKIINLLPKTKQREVVYRKVFRGLLRLVMVSGVSFLLIALFQFSSRLYMLRSVNTLQADTEKIRMVSNKQDNADIKKQIQKLNNEVQDFNTLAKAAPKWSPVISAFSAVVPEQTYIQSFTIDAAKLQVDITGFAPSRDSVIALYNNILADTSHFSNINYPLENVSNPTNVQFRFSFTVNKDVIK